MKLGYTNLLQSTAKWRPVLLVDETGLRQSAANHCHVAVGFIGRCNRIRQSAAFVSVFFLPCVQWCQYL